MVRITYDSKEQVVHIANLVYLYGQEKDGVWWVKCHDTNHKCISASFDEARDELTAQVQKALDSMNKESRLADLIRQIRTASGNSVILSSHGSFGVLEVLTVSNVEQDPCLA